ncbi:MAG: hypothetical protein LGL72_11070 [Acidibrevibacterium sp.]|jgi:hypothetical protein|nr:hypothetical protein [Acidibrevibacterium fodinaquatile]
MEIVIEEIEDQTIRVCIQHSGLTLEVVADVRINGEIMVASNVHIQGPGKNCVGWPGLRQFAEDLIEELELDELRIEGAPRTSGAGPGRKPCPLVFRRQGRHPDP